MKLPEKLKIGSEVYTVLFPYSFKERADLSGQHDGDLNELRIMETDTCGNKRPQTRIIATFIHEIFHAIDFQLGYGLFNDTQGEKAVEGFSRAILAFLLDNGYLKLEED